jgi:hypothetical protein
MTDKLWMFSVFIFLILIAPIFLIMMLLVLTDIPLIYSFCWLPVAIGGSWLMTKWACRESQKLLDKTEKRHA